MQPLACMSLLVCSGKSSHCIDWCAAKRLVVPFRVALGMQGVGGAGGGLFRLCRAHAKGEKRDRRHSHMRMRAQDE